MNPVAETLTGWSAAEALGKHLEDVFRIVNEETRKPIEQPVRKVIDTGLVRGLGNHTLLIARDGSELPIDDSAAPIWGESGELVGVVLIFRDITERRHGERLLESARSYAESIVATVRGPLLVLDRELHVRTANRSFYETFGVTPPEVIGRFIYDLGDGQWDIPALRTLLEDIVPTNSCFEDFEVEHDFEHIGPKTMLLNARRFPPGGEFELLLLAIEDITDRKRLAASVATSEVRYRRLFEAARTASSWSTPTRAESPTRIRSWSIARLSPRRARRQGALGDRLLGDEQASREAFRNCSGRALSATRICRSNRRPGYAARSSSSATSIRRTATGSSSATSATSPTASGWRRSESGSTGRRGGPARAEANEAKLAEADRRKDEFIAILAHELRNPLSNIRMAAHILRRPTWGENREQGLGVITHQVGALNRLIEDLLDVSRISKGKVHLRREPWTSRPSSATRSTRSRRWSGNASTSSPVSLPPDP